MAFNHLLGRRGKLLYGAGDEEAGNIQDLTLNITNSETDVTKRSDRGFRTTAPVLHELEVSFTLIALAQDDPLRVALNEAYLNSESIAAKVLDEEDNGPVGSWWVQSMTRNEEIGERIAYDVTLKPEEIEDWYEDGAGTYDAELDRFVFGG
ncbi:MAG: hypothetical protein LC136_09255 [Burkholderiales bacterium]|nr:hypothetical protein [Burkholderiales bacterium]